MTARGRRILAVTATAAQLMGCAANNPSATTPTPIATTTTTATRTGTAAATGVLTAAQINRQDHPPRGLLRRQQQANRQRPMLPALPITTSRVRIAIDGLDRDGHTTILTLTSHRRSGRGRAHALRVYRRQLRRYGDSGHSYRVRVSR